MEELIIENNLLKSKIAKLRKKIRIIEFEYDIHLIMNKELLTPDEVNTRYGFSISTLAKSRMMGNIHVDIKIPFFKKGKYIKYRVADIEKFIDDNMITIKGTK